MKQQYQDFRFRADTLVLIELINKLIASYQSQGYMLSVRQLYYQLVARDLIENTEKSYKRIASIINDARLAGLMDWDAIEDRNREIEVRPSWASGADIVDSAARSFHMDMWDNQDARVFVIVEKAALAGILGGVCRKFDVPLLAARGYPSVSIVRQMALDHISGPIDRGQRTFILHLGDHDPSGIDMTRDLRERFTLFLGAEQDIEHSFTLMRLALNMDQINELKPPPNPAKTTDARFAGYIKKFGPESWELDALEPDYIVDLVEGHIENLIDSDRWGVRVAEIEAIRDNLKKTAINYRKAE